MRGLMTERPLLIIDILRHAANVHRDAEVISVTGNDAPERRSYAEVLQRTSKLANALIKLGMSTDSVVGTLAWNNFKHLEIYYATAGIGAVCHTINPRLSATQVEDLIKHASDDLLFVEGDLFDSISHLVTKPGFPRVVILGEADADLPPHTISYEQIVEQETDNVAWPILDERTASSLCYTSGTTGNPKGILYSHRSSVLHAMSVCRTDTWAISGDDVICLFAPMFHVNGWGIPHAAPICGADLVLPGPHLSPQEIYRIIEDNHVTFALAVPTLWHGLLNYLGQTGQRLSRLRRILVSGSPLPPDMLSRFEANHGVDVLQAWGMTESSPMGMVSRLSRRMKKRPIEEQHALRLQQGRPVFGIEAKLNNVDGMTTPSDQTIGECAIRGHWVASSYFKGDASASEAFLDDGWFETGDVATIDSDGFFRIVDRRKDAIKSGGEWISSIEMETAARQDSQIIDAAAVAIPDEKWGERPALVISVRDEHTFDREQLLNALRVRLQKWALPDHILILPMLPRSTAGKLLKNEIREKVRTMLATSDQTIR
ncbi:long-chain fatty acid--CoA ligase [Afipia massiliensis]|uniref:Long-chain fatty acid--CoA ligase n=1 Tax=Afipia massiliensis TaxID=211460 RepID=A0A4U6BKV6_9BRAD|nr:long-chain-fatty-acid--CoA ligase [Afipia massiliensis]TKT70852.1 long-chain fatty acid--CoA ligase [Afipia massiliensis]